MWSIMSTLGSKLLVLLYLLSAAEMSSSGARHPVSISAFNVQRFGVSKMLNEQVADTLVRILTEFSITLVQEIMDKEERSIKKLLDKINTKSPHQYGLSLSDKVGSSSYEQYAYIYRKDQFRVVDERLYDDVDGKFERKPYIVTFETESVQNVDKFTLVGIHAKPSRAAQEVDALLDVLQYVIGEMNINNVAILGDFNFGCNYVNKAERQENRLRKHKAVLWVVEDHVDTTVADSNCAYDRIVLHGELKTALVPNSQPVFRYGKEWELSIDLVTSVSDHYPVFFRLKPAVNAGVSRKLQPFDVISVIHKRKIGLEALLQSEGEAADFSILPLYDGKAQLRLVRIQHKSYRLSAAAILASLLRLQQKRPELIHKEVIELLAHKIKHGSLEDSSAFAEETAPRRWYAWIQCTPNKEHTNAICKYYIERRTSL